VDLFLSLPATAGFFSWRSGRAARRAWRDGAHGMRMRFGNRWRGALETMIPMAAQRMTPVDPSLSQTYRPQVMEMAMFLPQFVREKKCDDEQRNHQKNAQYQVLDHGGLRSQEHGFIVEHRTCRAGA
jgi:hypothetical protein